MNLSVKRIYGKTLAIVLAVSMLLTGPIGMMEAHAEDGTPPVVQSTDSGTQDGGSSPATPSDMPQGTSLVQDSGTQEGSSSPATPSDMPQGTSLVQDSGAPIPQQGAAAPTLLTASVTATVTATAGYQTVSVNLTGSEIFADQSVVESEDNWLIKDSNLLEVEITSISRQNDKSVRLTLRNPIQPETYTLFVGAVVFAPVAGDTQEFNVTVHIPVPAVGTATASAGGKTIAVNLTQGGFANSSNTDNWTLGGTSAGGNPMTAVAYQDGSNVTITLTNPIGTSDVYTLQAGQDAFANIMTMPFNSPLNVTINPGDTTPPAFADGSPSAGSSSMVGRRQVGLGINAQEPAYHDFVVVPSGAAAPTAQQVREGKGADGNPALYVSHYNSKSDGIGTSAFTPLHNTDYDVYVILRDDAGNLSEPAKVSIKSPPAADFLAGGYPKTGAVQPNGSKQVQIQVQVQGTDRDGKVYWVLLPDGASAPTIEEVGAGTASGGGTPVSSGSPEFANGAMSNFLVTGAQDATAYDLYLVVGDTLNASPLAECTDVLRLDVATPAAGAPAFEVVGGTQYATLSDALGAVGNNGTIKLLRSANTTENINLENKAITLNLNNFDLNISSPANEGIKVTDGTLAVTGSGKLSATGKLYGVWANDGIVTVDDATSGNDGIGVYAMGGSKVTVRGNATGQNNGVYATDSGTVVAVTGNATSTDGQIQGAVYALSQAVVTVGGNVSSASGYGAHTSNSGVIIAEGGVYGIRAGALTEGTGGSITVKGDLSSYNHCAVITNGSGGNITVEGTVTPQGSASYVLINNVSIVKTAGVADSGKPGYLKYSGSGATGVVWVKDSTAAKVCEIAGGIQYTSLADALSDVTNGQTIKLLQNITHTASVEVNGMGIIFDLNNFDLTIDTSTENGSTALLVKGGGVVNYTGAGKFSAIGNSIAVHADGAGSKLTVGYAETTRGSAYTVQATAGGDATVNGNVLAKDAGTSALWATGGKITVQGNVTCAGDNSTGVISTGTGSTVHVTGDITATAIGTGSTGVNLKGDGEVTIIGNIAASQIGITTSGLGNAGTVTVTGNVSITGTATGSGVVDREGIGAGGNGTVLVTGNVSAAGENCTGVYANGSTVTVTGNVTSENTGVVSTGNASLPGSVTIDGKLTASTTYIKVGTTPKTAAEDNKSSSKVGYLQYTDGTHSVYIKDASGIILVKNATELKDALGNVVNGGTIKLLNAINYNQGIVIDGKGFCLDLGSYTLNVVNSAGIGIDIKNAILTVSGDGKLNATGTKGVQAQNSEISVYSATGTAGAGVEAFCGFDKSCKVTVTTHTQGTTSGVYAMNDNCKITAASAKATGNNGKAAYAEVGGIAEISGNVDAPNGYGVYCVNGSATIGGHVTGKDTAVYLYEKGSIVISGNVNADNGNGTAVEIEGNGNPANGTVTIEGTVSASDASYVLFVNGVRTKNQGVLDGAYLKYTDGIDGEKAGIVRVKKVNAVCTIGAQEFTSLSDALSAASSGDTITLLQTITHTAQISVDNKTLTFNLGDYDLLLDTSANQAFMPALKVENGGKVKLSGTGTGEFHVKGRSGISAIGVGVEVTVHTVETKDGSGVYMYGSGTWLESNSTVTVLGSADAGKDSITVGDGTGVNMNAKDGKVFVTGNITSGRDGVYIASNPGTQATVNGNITVTSDSPTANLVGIRAYGATAVTVTGDVTVLGADCLGVHASASMIKVGGNVASTGKGAQSDAKGKVEITGSLSAGSPFITVGATEMTADQGTEISGGFRLYTDGTNTVQIGSVGNPVPILYTATVQTDGNGTASASPSVAAAGTEIALTASPNSNYRFKEWQVVSGGVTITANKFTMPSGNVTVKAIFEPVAVVTHLVTVNGSYAGTSGAGQYAPGAQVSIHAGSRSNYSFTGWTTSDGVTFANAGNSTTTFTMPGKNVAVTANWSYSGGSGDGSGGGGYTAETPKSAIPTEKQPNMPTTATMGAAGTVKDGVLSATITEQMVKDAIKAAQDAAKKSGKEVDGIALDFNITGSGSHSSLNATLDAGAIARLKEAGVKFINIGSAVLDVTLDTGAIAEIDRQSSGTVTISAKKLNKLSDAAKKLIGNRPVFDITVTYQKNGKTEPISNFGKGAVTLGLAYKATDKEKTGNLFGVYVDKNGKPQMLTNSSYDNGRLIFSRNTLSTYGVGYKAPAPAFTDTAKYWAKDNIDFVVSRNLISGTTATTFAPNTSITRADFLTALGRLSGADVSVYKASSFTDVKSSDSTMPYIEWAVKNKIVQGIGDGKFGPALSITREQMAVMMQNYAKATGYKLPTTVAAVTFFDSAKISAYAKDAVKAIQQAGIMQGKGSNTFDSQGNATRGEAATILRRFVEIVIDEGAARGWNQNDAGQWQYISENGKPVTGWLTVENGKYNYYFDSNGIMISGKWLEIDGKWYYFYADGALAKNTKIDEYEVDENGVRKSK